MSPFLRCNASWETWIAKQNIIASIFVTRKKNSAVVAFVSTSLYQCCLNNEVAARRRFTVNQAKHQVTITLSLLFLSFMTLLLQVKSIPVLWCLVIGQSFPAVSILQGSKRTAGVHRHLGVKQENLCAGKLTNTLNYHNKTVKLLKSGCWKNAEK